LGAAPQKSDTPSIEAAAAPPDETSRWVAALPDVLRGRLAAVGLIDAPERAERLTLKPFLVPTWTGARTSSRARGRPWRKPWGI